MPWVYCKSGTDKIDGLSDQDREVGTPLAWPEAKQASDQVRDWGIKVGDLDFLSLSLTIKATFDDMGESQEQRKRCIVMGRRGRCFMHPLSSNSAAQVEYIVAAFDDSSRKVRLSLCQAEVLKSLAKDEELSKQGGCVPALQDSPQYAPSFGAF